LKKTSEIKAYDKSKPRKEGRIKDPRANSGVKPRSTDSEKPGPDLTRPKFPSPVRKKASEKMQSRS